MGKGQTTKRLSNKISPRRMQVTNEAIYNDKIPQKTKKKKKKDKNLATNQNKAQAEPKPP